METINALGRRKTAVARVYVSSGKGTILINGKDINEYFPTVTLQNTAKHALKLVDVATKYDIVANLDGGGISGQAEALCLGIARALVKINPEHKTTLRNNGLMTRDPRMVERKKPGQKKARKRFQFSKR
ncbi:MAG: 30S ribosomal protein S9 [Bacteroidetes bacterium RIFCSPLOWO2_12_FULL_31_6]|nr:MAG: 30S ribosomal protein S9 [Bacteroidetes bacterium RIFCSPLOWO2_12_FULL_31_6]